MPKDFSSVDPFDGGGERLQPSGLLEGDFGRPPASRFSRRLKIQLSIGLGLLLAAAIVGGGYGIRYQQRRHAETFLREAVRAEKAHQFSDAAKFAEGCIALAPQTIEAYVLQARLLRRLGQTDAADQCIARMVAANSDVALSHVWRGRYSLETGHAEAAEEELIAALQLAPDERAVVLLAVDYWLDRRRLDLARVGVRRLQELYPGDVVGWSRLADIETRCGNRSGAIAAIQRGWNADPKNTRLLFALVNGLCEQERSEEARKALESATGLEQDQALLKLLAARVAYAQGRWTQAAGGFEEVRPNLIQRQEFLRQLDYWLGDCYGQLGNHRRQIAQWRMALADHPRWASLRRQIVEALAACGQIEGAIEEARHIEQAGQQTGDDKLTLAHLLIVQAMRVAPSQRHWDKVETLLGAAAAVPQASLPTFLLQAELLAAQNRARAAAEVLLAAHARFPESSEVWLALAGVACQQDDPAAALGWLDQGEKQCGPRLPLRIARAAYLLRQLGPAAAPALQKLAFEIPDAPAAEQLPLSYALAAASLQAEDYLQAEKLCLQPAAARHFTPSAWLLEMELALRRGRSAGLESRLHTVEQLDGPGASWHYGKAVYFTLKVEEGAGKFLGLAREHLSKARELAPAWPCLPLLAAEIDRLAHRDAAANYLQAVELGEGSPLWLRPIFEYLQGRQRYLEIQRIVQNLIHRPATLLCSVKGGNVQAGWPADDLAQAQRAAQRKAAGSSHVLDHLWCAQLNQILAMRAQWQGRTDQAGALFSAAEARLEQAAKLAPTEPAVWMARFQSCLATNQEDKARQILRTAEKEIAAAELPCWLAQAYELLGEVGEAEKSWDTMLLSATSTDACNHAAEFFERDENPQRWRSRLEALADGQMAGSVTTTTWARRKVAWILSRGGDEDRQRGIQLVEHNLSGPAPLAEDRQLKGILLASLNDHAARQAAIPLLESVLADDWRDAPEGKFSLAQLCQAEGDYVHARTHLVELVQYFPEEPRFLAVLIHVLLEGKEIPLAESLVRRLERLAPGDFLTVTAQAELLLCRNEDAAIPPLFHQYVAKVDKDKPHTSLWQDRPAAVLEEFAARLRQLDRTTAADQLAAAAVAVRRETMEKQPRAALPLAVRLAEQGKPAEALAWLDKVSLQVDHDALCDTAIRLLLAAKTAAERAPIEKFLLDGLEQSERPAALLVAAALVYTLQEHYEKSERLLREALGKEPARVPALNNLALQLALQKRQLDEALGFIQRAIQFAGPTPALLDTRAVVYCARGETAKALQDLNQAIARAPNPLCYFHKARVLSALKDPAGARQADAQARRLDLTPQLLHPLERER
jgi:tetratricopeptide (TPR) repeat protein